MDLSAKSLVKLNLSRPLWPLLATAPSSKSQLFFSRKSAISRKSCFFTQNFKSKQHDNQTVGKAWKSYISKTKRTGALYFFESFKNYFPTRKSSKYNVTLETSTKNSLESNLVPQEYLQTSALWQLTKMNQFRNCQVPHQQEIHLRAGDKRKHSADSEKKKVFFEKIENFSKCLT